MAGLQIGSVPVKRKYIASIAGVDPTEVTGAAKLPKYALRPGQSFGRKHLPFRCRSRVAGCCRTPS